MLNYVQNYFELENRLIDMELPHIINAKCAVAVFCRVLELILLLVLIDLRAYCKFICHLAQGFLGVGRNNENFLGAKNVMKLSNYNRTE